jgi:hypothetical protein
MRKQRGVKIMCSADSSLGGIVVVDIGPDPSHSFCDGVCWYVLLCVHEFVPCDVDDSSVVRLPHCN